MASIAPVCSPTPIICVPIPGKTSVSFNGSTNERPASTAFRVWMMAFSTTALPEVRAVISNPSRIGTPLAINVPSVRVNRATAILRSNGPTSGTLSTSVSSAILPEGVPYQNLNRKAAADTEHRDHQTVNAANKVAQHNHDASWKRQVHTQSIEQRGENRHDLPQEKNDHATGDAHDRSRIDCRRLDSAFQFDVLLDVGREPLQNGVENAARLAGLDHVVVESIEDFVVLLHRR